VSTPPTLVPVADHGVLVVFGEEISAGLLARIHALDAALGRARPLGMTEIVPAMTTLLVAFDPTITDHVEIGNAVLANLAAPSDAAPGAHHIIDVCYDGEHAPDLATVAERAGIEAADVVAAHTGATFTVGMYGFAPGYAYLYGTPESIQLPRNPTPGPAVPAGSVIIAGQQCLVIPVAMSTGWFAIGRTATAMLLDDPERPFLVDVGDTVTFNRVSASELQQRLAERGERST
jgi:inhibitor of KinA